MTILLFYFYKVTVWLIFKFSKTNSKDYKTFILDSNYENYSKYRTNSKNLKICKIDKKKRLHFFFFIFILISE